MAGPLADLRVVEVANWLAAPSAAALMADMGADVIKVEPPGGEDYRHTRNLGFGVDFPLNYAFELDNRGKRSVGLALDAPSSREVMERLIANADIFITNLLQPRRERFGLTNRDVRRINPRAIYVSFSGYGTEGPDAGRAGFDFAAFWARSGVMSLLQAPGQPPIICRSGQGDHTTALNLLAATLAALRLRDQTGEGQEVDVTLLGTGIWTVGSDVSHALVAGSQPAQADRSTPLNPLANVYRCADDRWVLLIMPVADAYWERFCRMLQRPQWVADPRYATLAARRQHTAELTAAIDGLFAEAALAQWAERLDRAGLIWAPMATLPEVLADPAVLQLDPFAAVTHPTAGLYRTLQAPFRIAGADIGVRGPAPEAGEHTVAVLSELGFDDVAIARLADAGALGAG